MELNSTSGQCEPEEGRAKRSRRDRPCDLYSDTIGRQKLQCEIPVKGQKCKVCDARNRKCTFEMPPTARVRPPKPDRLWSETEITQGTWSIRHRSREPSSPASHTLGGSDAILTLIRKAKYAPPHPKVSSYLNGASLLPTATSAELHYINSRAFSDTTFSVDDNYSPAHPADLSFRQVSANPTEPVFFVSTPSLMYGTVIGSTGPLLWDSIRGVLAADAPEQLTRMFLERTQPAFPILDDRAFQNTNPAALIAAGMSYGLLGSFVAHSTCYVAEIRPHHKFLWRQVLLALEDDYRRPTLQTIQLALIITNSRPAINVGQNTIAMGRLISAAQLLGLHLDCARWRIPSSERILRQRIWWAILISDKWRSALYGRPTNISFDDCNVPLPKVESLTPDVRLSVEQEGSLWSFVGMCKLTIILDELLTGFFTVRAMSSPKPPAEQLRMLELATFQLAVTERDLPSLLLAGPIKSNSAEVAPAGVRSFQLCKFGLELILYRLAAGAAMQPSSAQQHVSFAAGLKLAHSLVEFLENLITPEYGQFWSPYCSIIIANVGAALLRIALTSRADDSTTRTTAGVFFTRLVVVLTSAHHAATWDVASLALDRIATLLHSLNGELPELIPLLQLFGTPHHAISSVPPQQPSTASVPIFAHPASTEPHPISPSHSSTLSDRYSSASYPPVNLYPRSPPSAPPAVLDPKTPSGTSPDPFWWMRTEIRPMPGHFGDISGAFEDWGAGIPGAGGEEGADLGLEGAGENVGGFGMHGPGGEGTFDLLGFLQGTGLGAANGA